MNNVKELKIWQKSMELVKLVYNLVSELPANEKYGLISQIKRCSVSIPSNISEGAGRNSKKEFIHFLSISNGSAYELQTQLILTIELKLLSKVKVMPILELLVEVQKMNYSLQKSIENKLNTKN